MKRSKKISHVKRSTDDRYVDLGSEPRWFVLQFQPQLAETADYNLRRQNFTLFLPLIQIRQGRKLTVTEPMFRGYGFVRFNPATDGWGAINGTRGVIGLLPRHSAYPHPMPVGLVENFLKNDPMHEEDFFATIESFVPGVTEVTIGHGLLAGRSGTYLDRRGLLLQLSVQVDGRAAALPVWVDEAHVRVK